MGFIRVIYANYRKIMAIRANTAKYRSLTGEKKKRGKKKNGVPGRLNGKLRWVKEKVHTGSRWKCRKLGRWVKRNQILYDSLPPAIGDDSELSMIYDIWRMISIFPTLFQPYLVLNELISMFIRPSTVHPLIPHRETETPRKKRERGNDSPCSSSGDLGLVTSTSKTLQMDQNTLEESSATHIRGAHVHGTNPLRTSYGYNPANTGINHPTGAKWMLSTVLKGLPQKTRTLSGVQRAPFSFRYLQNPSTGSLWLVTCLLSNPWHVSKKPPTRNAQNQTKHTING